MNRDLYSAAAEFIDSSDPDVHAFARQETAGAADAISRAVKLYYAVATARSVGIPARDPSLNAKPMAEMRFIL